jgi:hypothetical protein
MHSSDDEQPIFAIESDGEENGTDWGLYRAATVCGPERYFDFDRDTRDEYRRFDSARARRFRQAMKSKGASRNEEDDDSDATVSDNEDLEPNPPRAPTPPVEAVPAKARRAVEAGRSAEEDEDEDPGPPSPRSAEAEDDGIPRKPDGSVDRQKLWQRYRAIARESLAQRGLSTNSKAVNSEARSIYRQDGW